MSALKNVYESTISWAEQRKINLHHREVEDSTNNLAKAQALSESTDFKLYLTAHQSMGRGRGQNTWTDTGAGECLLSSWSFALKGAPQSITGPCLGLALLQAAKEVWASRSWSLKAPNDLYLDGKKVAGILAETVSSGENIRLIVGIGMNVLNHPRAIENSTHLNNHTDEVEWFRFLDALLIGLKFATGECQKPSLSEKQCQDLMHALNANPAKTFTVQQVTPEGDIIHSKGRIRWVDL